MNDIESIASEHLGQESRYVDHYDPTLLVKIPRSYNREVYGINEQVLPFVGTDVWHAYEVSALTEKGLPVNGVLKIIVPADTACLFESKSAKLYMNSFNMTKLGKNQAECIALIEKTVAADLSKLLDATVQCRFYEAETSVSAPQQAYTDLSDLVNLDDLDFQNLTSDKNLLQIKTTHATAQCYQFQTNLLRSNCRVTNQPDWGDVLVYMKTTHEPDFGSFARYIVSHRQLNHFHEEVCEMIFVHLQACFKPEQLMVICLYTRRGGIDINPVRATDAALIPETFTDLEVLNQRTIRQ